jgi:hypothetical protein
MLYPAPELPDDTPIDNVRLTTRIRNAMTAADWKTVGEIREASYETAKPSSPRTRLRRPSSRNAGFALERRSAADRTEGEKVRKEKKSAEQQVADQADRRALNPLATRQTIADSQAAPKIQENLKRLKAERLAGQNVCGDPPGRGKLRIGTHYFRSIDKSDAARSPVPPYYVAAS